MLKTPRVQRGEFTIPLIHGEQTHVCTWLKDEDGSVMAVQIHCPFCNMPVRASDRLSESQGRLLCYLRCPECRGGQLFSVTAFQTHELFEWLKSRIRDGSYEAAAE